MSTFRHPVGSQPPRVYWRRRLAVAIGALVVIVVVLLIVFSPKGNGSPAAEQTSSAPASSQATPVAPATCDIADLVLEATVDKTHYGAGELPQLSFSITNNGDRECQFSAGSDVQEFVITSAKEKYWSSKDCQTSPTPAVTTIAPGESVGPGAPLEWDRTRSSPDSCDAEREQVPAGGPTYALTVTVNGLSSEPVRFILD